MEEIGLQRYTPGEPSQDWELRSTCSKKMIFKLRHKIVRSSLPSLGILNMMALIENLIKCYLFFVWLAEICFMIKIYSLSKKKKKRFGML